MHHLYTITLSLLLTYVHSQGDAPFCNVLTKDINLDKEPLPTIPPRFSAAIETNIPLPNNQGISISSHEYMDKTANKGAITSIMMGSRDKRVFDFTAQRVYYINMTRMPFDDGACVIKDFSDPEAALLGGGLSGNAFWFVPETKKEYVGREEVRGIRVNHWKTCINLFTSKALVTIDWYFTVQGVWTNAGSPVKSAVPVRVNSKGRYYEGPQKGTTFELRHDIFNFNPNLKDRASKFMLQIPPGYFCDGYQTSEKMPPLPRRFSFDAEVSQPDIGAHGYTKEIYDFTANMTRMDYYPLPMDKDAGRYGKGMLTKIHDFVRGVEYVKNNDIGNCTYRSIDSGDYDAEKLKDDSSLVRMRSPEEFFYTDKYPYFYRGPQQVRGVDVKAFVIRRTDWPQPLAKELQGLNSTFEWSFSNEKDDNGKLKNPLPMKMVIRSEMPGLDTIYNFFNFRVRTPDFWEFDVTECFNKAGKKHYELHFTTSKDNTNDVIDNLNTFRYWFVFSLSGLANISPIRVSKIDVFSDSKGFNTEFTLSEHADIKGDVANPPTEQSLATVSRNLENVVNAGKFNVDFLKNGVVFSLVADKDSISEISKRTVVNKSTGYSPGAMGGLGFAMVVFGTIGGGVVSFFLRK